MIAILTYTRLPAPSAGRGGAHPWLFGVQTECFLSAKTQSGPLQMILLLVSYL